MPDSGSGPGPDAVFDFRFLVEASETLHGYLLHTWFTKFLEIPVGNLHRWIAAEMIDDRLRPTEVGEYRILFDYGSVDRERLAYLCGFYLFILFCHKRANHQIMVPGGAGEQRVLYLSGFDFVASIGRDGAAVGMYSADASRMSRIVEDVFCEDVEVFKALSPMDLWRDTADAAPYFLDYERLIGFASHPIRKFHLNARYWQQDIETLVDKVDHVLVHLSSITPSVLWELDLLESKGRSEDVLVVFDEEAVGHKTLHTGLQEALKGKMPELFLWEKAAAGPDVGPQDLRRNLEDRFRVVSLEAFEREATTHLERFRARGIRTDGPERRTHLPFRFRPALPDKDLQRIVDYDEALERDMVRAIEEKAITNLPLFLNQVQLRLYTALMLGNHFEAGRVLARFTTIVELARQNIPDMKAEHEELLERLAADADYISFTMLSIGDSHEFDDFRERARREQGHVKNPCRAAVEAHFEEVARRTDGFQRLRFDPESGVGKA